MLFEQSCGNLDNSYFVNGGGEERGYNTLDII